MQINDIILKEWKNQSKKDGCLVEYEYHLGMIFPPLPYRKWKMKFDLLNSYQARPGYQEGKDFGSSFDKRVNDLCIELGY
jgi:hypothetical protein